jgi:hypothetical protein
MSTNEYEYKEDMARDLHETWLKDKSDWKLLQCVSMIYKGVHDAGEDVTFEFLGDKQREMLIETITFLDPWGKQTGYVEI